MAQSLQIAQGASKKEIYQEILPQIKATISDEPDLIANLANISAILHEVFPNLWTGFYIAQGNELVLGPFQGPLACTRIAISPTPRGVCGSSAAKQETFIVPNVEEFPGHIACSSRSKSEIVVPLIANGETKLVLDIDSEQLNAYDETDQQYLEEIINLIKLMHYV